MDAAALEMLPNELLLAYLDDIYACTTRDRAREVFDIIQRHVHEQVGIRTHLGKTKCWSKGGGGAPDGISQLDSPGEEPVWKGDLPPAKNGVVVLGAPVGCVEFANAFAEERMKDERSFLELLPTLPDLQCAWLLLYFCAVPRANYLLRCVPPSLCHRFALEHDEAIWRAFSSLLGEAHDGIAFTCRQIAQLPCRLGGLGLRSAVRTSPSAYWSAWADVLPTLRSRFPAIANDFATRSIVSTSYENALESYNARRMFCGAMGSTRQALRT